MWVNGSNSKGKFVALNVYISQEERHEINEVMLEVRIASYPNKVEGMK